MNILLSKKQLRFTGPAGSLLVPEDDEVSRRLAMLIEGQCEGLGPSKAAEKYDFTRQRYYQILHAFYGEGAEGLVLQSPGPKTDYRRTDQVVRLGTWDLMRSWSGAPPERVEPRLALHLVNEAAMCLCSYRHGRTLSQKGFELANGLPFVPTDLAIHDLLQDHTVEQAQRLQIALGKLRRAGKHFEGTLLALDPHRITSYSKRQMRRHRFSSQEKPSKMAQTFFLLDCHTGQPVCFSLSSSAQSVAQASPPLLDMAAQILGLSSAKQGRPLVLADKEHYIQELFSDVRDKQVFDLLCALPAYPQCVQRWSQIPATEFVEHWPGYFTTAQPYQFKEQPQP